VLGFIASAPAPAQPHTWAASSLEHVVHHSVCERRIRLQGARVCALVGNRKPQACWNMCGWALKPSLAATPSRATILRHPAVVKGARAERVYASSAASSKSYQS
jgi:hypothetical protein